MHRPGSVSGKHTSGTGNREERRSRVERKSRKSSQKSPEITVLPGPEQNKGINNMHICMCTKGGFLVLRLSCNHTRTRPHTHLLAPTHTVSPSLAPTLSNSYLVNKKGQLRPHLAQHCHSCGTLEGLHREAVPADWTARVPAAVPDPLHHLHQHCICPVM